ncbi:hypothetical protein L0F63_006732, partial [Massospora cicadina]
MSFGDQRKGPGWGDLFKQAINNVESKLDKVLDFPDPNLERNNVSASAIPTSKPRSLSKFRDPLRASSELEPIAIKPNPTSAPTQLKDEIVREQNDLVQSTVRPPVSEPGPTPETSNASVQVAASSERLAEEPIAVLDYRVIAEQREKQLNNAIQSTAALNETIHTLQNELAALKVERVAEEKRLAEIILELESKVGAGAKENSDSKLLKQIEELQRQLDSKAQQVADLLLEGERLSKREVKVSTILQRLRVKEAESDRALADCQKKLGQSVKETSELKTKINSLNAAEKAHVGNVRALNAKIDQLTKEKERFEAQILKLAESETGLKASLVKAQQELKTRESESGKASQEAQNAAINKERQENQKLAAEVSALRSQLEELEGDAHRTALELRQALSRAQDESSSREEELLKELKEWQDRQMCGFQYGVDPIHSELESVIEASTKPLLAELASLREQFNQVQLKRSACERDLKRCMAQSDEQRCTSDQAQRALIQELRAKQEDRIERLESSCEAFELRIQELQAELDRERTETKETLDRIDELQGALKTAQAQHAQEWDPSHKLLEPESPAPYSGSPGPLLAAVSSARTSVDAASQFSSRLGAADPIEFSEVRSEKSQRSCLDLNLEAGDSSQAASDSKLRSLQAQLRSSIEARDHLASDLVRVTARLKLLEKDSARLAALELEHKALLVKHETALILLGEREEQVAELKADVQEMKAEYRSQISDLVAKLHASRA